MPNAPRHAAVKARTAPLHRQLEANPINAALLTDTLSLEAYAHLLARYFGFYDALETHLSAYLAFHPKTPWLHADLVQLGSAPAMLPRCARLPRITGTSAAVGSLYVLEGATLGGQIITRHLRKTLPGAPTRFFRGYGTQTGTRWKAFLEKLEAHPQDDVIAAAKATYRCFDAWLTASPAPGA